MDPSVKPAEGRGFDLRTALLVGVALAVWAVTTFGHKVGLGYAARLFQWSKEPGALHADGGEAGMQVLERLMAGGFGAVALVIVALVVVRLRRAPLDKLRAELAPWLLWAATLYAVWKSFIVYPTELVHFGQYALVGALFAWALRDRPLQAFLITFSLGLGDEIYQHYVLAHGNADHWMDWSDGVLDGLGAVAGILPFTTFLRLRSEGEPPSSARLLYGYVGVLAVLLLPLLLLSPETQSWLLGHYRYFPYWGEYENHKPTHWPAPRDGIPLLIGCTLLLGLIVEPRRQRLSQGAMAGLAVLVCIAISPYSRAGGMPVHEVVPRARVARSAGPIVVDGALDEPAWERAERLGPFVRNRDGGPAERGATFARLLWDDAALYVAFEVTDTDVWARDTHRDDTTLPGDEVVELFLDDGGDEVTYYEVEVSPRNVVYDLFNFIPQAPLEFQPDAAFVGLARWDARKLETAVGLRGATVVDVRPFLDPQPEIGGDEGYVVELAFPWDELRTTTTPAGDARRPIPPRPGNRWRAGLFRVERPRPDPAAFGDEGALLGPAEARALVGCDAATFEGLVGQRIALVDPAAEGDARRFRQKDVVVLAAEQAAEYQAWAPTRNASFHRPQWFGVIEFGE